MFVAGQLWKTHGPWQVVSSEGLVMTPNEELVDRLLKDVGPRYRDVTLRSYAIGTDRYRDKRKAALDAAVRYLTGAKTTILKGMNLILYGTPGTGKDHLAIGVARSCAIRGLSARSISGQELFAAADRARRNGLDAIEPGLKSCRILVLSDPLPNAVTPSIQEAKLLMQLVDARYRNQLPTIVTANAEDERDLRDAMAGPLEDRLFGGAKIVEMKWTTFRN
jgi:DNA replication protein DnaC